MKIITPSFLVATVLLVALFLVNTITVYLIGAYAWDDGAITLAFSKTLAETGRFSLTASSEIVEGSSSLLMTFLMATLHFIFQFDFKNFILASQITTYFFLILTAFIIYTEANKVVSKQSYALIITALFALLPMFTSEIQNGMEMTLFSFLLALYYIKFDKGLIWLLVLTPFILLTRFEAIFYLGFPLLLLLVFTNHKKRIFLIGLYTGIIFLLISLFRWIYFGDILPNTIWAKINPPYSSGDFATSLFKRIAGLKDFFQITTFLLIPAILIGVLSTKEKLKDDIGPFIVIAFGVFTFISGKNWGYDGRMFLACLPIIIIMIFRMLAQLDTSRIQLTLTPQNKSKSIETKNILLLLLLSGLIFTHIINIYLHKDNAINSIKGGYYQKLLPASINSALQGRIDSNPVSYGITPANYRITGLAVNNLRLALNKKTIDVLVPDVGGLGLCCSQLKVLDSALLTNKELAKSGYKIFNEYLSRSLPDVIETHGVWSEVTDIYNSSTFKTQYIPIVFDNNLFWLRQDLYTQLSNSSLVTKGKLDKMFQMDRVRYAGATIDAEYLNALEISEISSFTWKG